MKPVQNLRGRYGKVGTKVLRLMFRKLYSIINSYPEKEQD